MCVYILGFIQGICLQYRVIQLICLCVDMQYVCLISGSYNMSVVLWIHTMYLFSLQTHMACLFASRTYTYTHRACLFVLHTQTKRIFMYYGFIEHICFMDLYSMFVFIVVSKDLSACIANS